MVIYRGLRRRMAKADSYLARKMLGNTRSYCRNASAVRDELTRGSVVPENESMQTQTSRPETDRTDSSVSFLDSQGVAASATLLRLNRYELAFEVPASASTLRSSEVLQEVSITISGRQVYSGNAVISSIVNTGTVCVCQAKLEESWVDLDSILPTLQGEALREGFGAFLRDWSKFYRIAPEYKSVIADMHTFLADLRLWLEQVELGIRAAPQGDRLRLEHDVAMELGESTTKSIGELFEKFEAIVSGVDRDQPDQRAAHSAFAKRLLHPLLLSSPFLYRTFRKPLGYAGDYEMVNMIWRDPLEGSTLFAKIVNLWFLRQPPAEAHRNRVRWLIDRIEEVTARALQSGKVARILSVGCGPALEVQSFMAEKEFSDRAQFTLIDFNQETAEHVKSTLESVRRKHHRQTQIQIVKKSVHQILKESARSAQGGVENRHDFVYVAGLFDYLSDATCRMLSNILYEWVAPGGLFVSTNVDDCNPRRLTMDYLMDWHLIYRRCGEMAALKPERAPKDQGTIVSDTTGVNLLYSAKKPLRG